MKSKFAIETSLTIEDVSAVRDINPHMTLMQAKRRAKEIKIEEFIHDHIEPDIAAVLLYILKGD